MTSAALTVVSRWTSVDGLRLHARFLPGPADGPARAPVVLVHGLGAASTYLLPLARRLAVRNPVFIPELPGFGRSAKPHRAYNVQELSAALGGWMAAVGVADAVLVGQSMGCQVVVDLAVRDPRRAARLVLLGPTVDARARNMAAQVALLLVDGLLERPSLLPILLRDYLRAGLVRLVRTARFAIEDRIEDRLPSVTVPIMVVRGSRDPTVSQRWVEYLTALAPRAELRVLPGAPHIVNATTPDRLTEVVAPFIAAAG